ncbi:MAG: PQQ-dependent sugar dehydrogenase [Hyphomicrobiaceae bacterium]
MLQQILASALSCGLCLAGSALAYGEEGDAPTNGVQTDAPAATKSDVKVTTVAEGLINPWSLQFLPDGRMLVTERVGNLRIVTSSGEISPPIKGVPKVYARGQGGLLDVRLAKDFAETGNLFLSYSGRENKSRSTTTVARAKLVLTDTGGALENVTVIFKQTPSVVSGRHFGSRIVLNDDGTLFITTGDRGSQSSAAQDPKKLIGKVIRINADGTVPDDNPRKSGWAPQVWSMGHRNIQGAALHPKTRDLWTVEHGARGGDELNQPQKGANYGWPVITYGRDYSGIRIGIGTEKEGLEQPVYYWVPSIATSGLVFYTGDLFANWKGNALVGGLAGSVIQRLVMKNNQVIAQESLLAGEGYRFRDLRQGPDGAVYVLTDSRSGRILKITPAE